MLFFGGWMWSFLKISFQKRPRFFSSAFLPFFGEGSPTKIDYRKKKGTLILSSLQEDLEALHFVFFPWPLKVWDFVWFSMVQSESTFQLVQLSLVGQC